jgi:glycosyltransferase involved in cell wall biosynthesis
VEQKRADRFLRVLRQIADRRPDLSFKGLVVGDGPLRSQLEQLANSLGLSPNRVAFLGELPDMKTAYEQSDLLVLTSDWEGTPNVLLEAMGCALPVVATNVGGVADIVEHKRTGLLAGIGQDASLAEAIVSLIENRQLREKMGAQARLSVLRRYSIDGLTESLMRVYQI